MIKSLLFPSLTSLLLIISFSSSAQKAEKKHRKKNKQQEQTTPYNSPTLNNANTAVNCDTSLWKYVYNRKRLQVTNECISANGVIVESSSNDDGDHHMLLKLDAGQEDLLTKVNIKKKQGNLVIEAVCANKVTLGKVGNICNGYINKIQIPTIGAHVKVTGSLVIDTHNGWAEIHPITKIEILK